VTAVRAIQVTVYQAGRRRYLTKRAAYNAAARLLAKARCECAPDSFSLGLHSGPFDEPEQDQCDYCDYHGTALRRLIPRLSRWLRWRDGRALRELDGGERE
jgi:hypothetical protein